MFMDWKKILLKCPYYPNYEKIQCNSYQNYNVFFFTEMEKSILKCIWNQKDVE